MSKLRGVAAIGVVVVVALIATACGSGSTATPTAATNSDVERPAGPAKPGGHITVALTGETNSFSPIQGQWSPASYLVANAIFDPLVALDPHGAPRPYLAKAITSDASFTEWRITLRPDIKFQNGQPFDAAAVKTNMDMAKSSPLLAQAFVSVESVSTEGDTTVVVHMNQPWSTYPLVLTTQAGYMAAPAMLTDPAGANAKPIGTGPFTFVSREVGSNLDTKKNSDYWQKDVNGNALPYLDAVNFRILTDSGSRTNSLTTGDVSAAQIVAVQELMRTNALVAGGHIQELTDDRATTDAGVIAFNTTKPPFNDPVARQAIAYGVDQIALAKQSYRNTMPGAWGMFEPGSPYYISKQKAGYPNYDPAKARQLAADYQRKHGEPLQFNLLVPQDPQVVTSVQFVQAALAKVGIKLKIQPVDQTTLITDVIVSGDYEASVFVLWVSPSPDQGYVFVASKPNPNGLSLNYTRFDDPDLTKAMNDFRATVEPAKQVEAITRVQQSLAKNLQMLFLVHTHTAFAYSNHVHGLRATTFPDETVAAYAPYPTTPFFTQAWTDQI